MKPEVFLTPSRPRATVTQHTVGGGMAAGAHSRTLERPTLGSVRFLCAQCNANVPHIHTTSTSRTQDAVLLYLAASVVCARFTVCVVCVCMCDTDHNVDTRR